MSTNLKIALAEPSVIVRNGLESLLKRLAGFRIQLIEIAHTDNIPESLRLHKPDLLLINPTLPGYGQIERIREESGCQQLKCFALLYALTDNRQLADYDDQINIYDNADEIRHKLERLYSNEPEEAVTGDTEEQQILSAREKEIVVCVVKGMTNREIADKLYLSTHTVITHRRNIARKLQIHSASGLTIYAIVNKLIALSDIESVSK
ncbi:MAG: LuxR C-terminal-related transcriptional regulator [Tannerellaceae bacterium]|nr:LuxR C-terminal-related transcriptional regulator [Tannerellaceae bacterium]